MITDNNTMVNSHDPPGGCAMCGGYGHCAAVPPRRRHNVRDVMTGHSAHLEEKVK